jgi:IS5 family transposase
MYKKPSRGRQGHLIYKDLLEQLNLDAPLLILARNIPWETLEKEFSTLYAEAGRPAKPVRLMVGLLLLKQVYNLSDDYLLEAWVQNPYFQAFCGIQVFQWGFPCDPSDITYFRKRLGEAGCEKIFKMSVGLHGKQALEKEVVIDTTVQEKNITFPTDTKLRVKIIGKCRKTAGREGLVLRRSFTRELPGLLRTVRFSSGKNKPARKTAQKRSKTIAGILTRELWRKLSPAHIANHREALEIFDKILLQTRNSKNKIYSVHETAVSCIAKGKTNKKYEFGAKAGIAVTKSSGIIVGVRNFKGNPFDGDTLDKLLERVKYSTSAQPEAAFCDRGFRGREQVLGTAIRIPGPPSGKASEHEKRKARKDFGRRSAIEPIIGHLKQDYRMARNYLRGVAGDAINLLLSAPAFNLNKWMRGLAPCLIFVLFRLWSIFTAKKEQKTRLLYAR